MSGNEDDDNDAARGRNTLGAALRASETADAVVRARLSAARAHALEGRRGTFTWSWAGAGAVVAAGVLAVVIALRPDPSARIDIEYGDLAQGEMLEALLDDDDSLEEAELYEDLDVLTWLAGEDERA